MTMSRSVSTETESMTHNKRLQNAWNHASFLINEAYDWERAAKQFESLERVVSHRLVKAILLLNIGITYSLLADYRQAEKAFQKVLPLHHFISPLAHYMLGLVRFELADYWQAQISFKLCACVLYQTGHLRDYRHLGLDFTLSHHLVVENEEMAAHEWTLQHKGRRGVRVLNRLPAPVMFDSTVLDSLAGAGCEGPIRPRVDGHASPSSVYSTHLAAIPSISATHATINHTLGSAPTTRVPPQIPRRPVRKQHMLPRAAQPETCDLRELAHFLKYTGPSNQVSSEVRTTTSTSISQRLSAVRTNTSNTTTSLTRPAVPLSEVATSVDARPGVFRKFSSQTLKSTSTVRSMTKAVFNIPLVKIAGQNRIAQGERAIQRPGPQRYPSHSTSTGHTTVASQKAEVYTIKEASREMEGHEFAQGDMFADRGKTSMDSHLIFSLGRLMM